MSEKRKINVPPVIRVFLSSTFADMEHERSYFNEVLAPNLGRICAERGVSFFNVDLRWGITEEDQIGGQVLPICLGEIDKCRPYFIGMIGNRYGSVMESVPERVSESIPWLEGKEGISITELEMLYAVLDHEKEDPAVNSAFYMRSDRLSRELYPDLVTENSAAAEKLDKLKRVIRSDTGVLCSDYDTIEEFGEKVMRDLLCWLDENFPESGDIGAIRRAWYNGEILRGHIENGELNAFLDSYIESSSRSLLFYGDGARGKTAALTAWEPRAAKKILINCASDEAYRNWSNVALRLLTELCAYLSDEDAGELQKIIENAGNDCRGGVLGEYEAERFRSRVTSCFRVIKPKCRVVVVINDLNLLSRGIGRMLSWLPADGGESLRCICSTNDSEMVENADVIGWNVREMPSFTKDRARELISDSLRVYGKNLSLAQFEALVSSTAASYPGQLRFVISFLLNHGRFNNLDRFASDISEISDVDGIYRYVYDFLIGGVSPREERAARAVFGVLRASDIALSEGDCYALAQKESKISPIEWAGACRIFEQFDLIHGDYWYIRDEETEKFVDKLLTVEEMKNIHRHLAIHLYEKLFADSEKGRLNGVEEINSRAKQIIESFRAARDYDRLEGVLCDSRVVSILIENEPSAVRSAWLDVFLETDCNVADTLIALVKTVAADISKSTAIAICRMMYALDMSEAHRKACEAIEVDPENAMSLFLWADRLSQAGVEIYQTLYELKNGNRLREISDKVNEILASKADGLNETDICKILYFKCDAEDRLGNYKGALATANEYYSVSLREGYAEDVQTALRMRASALFRLGRIDEALVIVRRTQKSAYDAGQMRDYLGMLNLTAMCYYRKSRFDESIEIFDRLLECWKKLGNKKEACGTVLNKSSALYLGDKVQEALEVAETFYNTFKGERGMLSSAAAFCGNIGIYASQLGLYDKAEKYLLDTVDIAKLIGAEVSLANAYASLSKLYEKTDSFKKYIDLYAEQMEFHWRRREYEKVMEIYKKAFLKLSTSNYKKQAIELEATWKARFSEIEGGLDYFEMKKSRHAVDAVSVERLLERAKIAASAGDLRGEAEAYMEASNFCEKDDPAQAAQYLIFAAKNFLRLDDRAMRIDVLESAVNMLFQEGQIVDMPILDTVMALAEDETIERIASIWRQLGDLAYAARMEEEGKMLSEDHDDTEVNALIDELLRLCEKNEYLTASCLFDLAAYLAKTLSGDAILALFSRAPEKYRRNLVSRFDTVMSDGMSADFNYLMKNYFGKRADLLIERYEKYVRVLVEHEGENAPAIAGNLALIFRRRKEKEKTFRYHALSAEIFRRAGKMEDCFIEIMNNATAHKELSSIPEAVDLLRTGLQEAVEKDNRKSAAMIAGNLASTLMEELREESHAEIERCFEIEESYFRASGYLRDLVISLLNQSIYYVKIEAALSRWSEKIKEARAIVTETNLDEFSTLLSQLEWRIAQNTGEKNTSEEDLRATLSESFANSGYDLLSFEREEGYYYVIVKPKETTKLYEEAIHAAIPFESDCCLRVFALIKPSLYKNDAPKLDEYITWWNNLDKYRLEWDKEEKQIKAKVDFHAKDWKQLFDRFVYFTKIWEADKVNCVSLMLDVADLDACRQAKLKLLEG